MAKDIAAFISSFYAVRLLVDNILKQHNSTIKAVIFRLLRENGVVQPVEGMHVSRGCGPA